MNPYLRVVLFGSILFGILRLMRRSGFTQTPDPVRAAMESLRRILRQRRDVIWSFDELVEAVQEACDESCMPTSAEIQEAVGCLKGDLKQKEGGYVFRENL